MYSLPVNTPLLKRAGFLRTKDFWYYVAKCLVGMSVCYAADAFFPGHRLYWSIISVLLVISPDEEESLRLPVTRMKANIAGSVIGLLCFLIPFPPFASMAAGVVLTIIVCYLFRLGAGTRTALAALVIVLVQESSDGGTISAVERVVSVLFGCIVALAVSVCASRLFNGRPR